MKRTKDEIIRNYFTKYIETALNRARRDYIKSGKKRNGIEVVSEPEGVLSSEVIYEVPWEPGAVRLFLTEAVGERMMITLSCLTDMELLIVFAKVFRQMTFTDIADRLESDWRKVASSYSYARKKMKKGWEKNGI